MKRRDFMRYGAAAAVSGVLPWSHAAARSAGADVSVRWLGGATLELDIDGFRILTDPCLGEGKKAFIMGDPNEMFDLEKGPNIRPHERLTGFPGLRHDSYDLVLLSHAHEDHFDQKAQAWLDRATSLICPSHDLAALAEKGFQAQALAHGAERVATAKNTRITITAVPAIHSKNETVAGILDQGNGYWIKIESPERTRHIYWAGDTFMVAPVQAFLASRPAPDLFIPHIGAVGANGALGQLSMTGGEALAFADQVRPGITMPIHHSSYALYVEPVSAIVAAAKPQHKLRIVEEGKAIDLTAARR